MQNREYSDYLIQAHGPEKARKIIEQTRSAYGGFTRKTYRGKPTKNSIGYPQELRSKKLTKNRKK